MIKKIKKITAASIVRKCFNMKRIPTDDAILRKIYVACPSSKFNEKMLAWYKSRARHGLMAGVHGFKMRDGRKEA